MEKKHDTGKEVMFLAVIAELFEKANTNDEITAILGLMTLDYERKLQENL